MYDQNEYNNMIATYRCIEEEASEKKRYNYLSGIVNFKFLSISRILLLLVIWFVLFFVVLFVTAIVISILSPIISFSEGSIMLANDICSLLLIPGWTILLPVITVLEPVLVECLQFILPNCGIIALPNVYQIGSASVADFWSKIFLLCIVYSELLATVLFICRGIKKSKLRKTKGADFQREMNIISQNSQNRQNWLHNCSIVPSGLWDTKMISILLAYMENGRADTLKEAINLYHRDLREQQRAYEEQRYRNEQLRLERERVDALDRLQAEERATREAIEYQSNVIRFRYR